MRQLDRMSVLIVKAGEKGYPSGLKVSVFI
jgi:hypothetical protein